MEALKNIYNKPQVKKFDYKSERGFQSTTYEDGSVNPLDAVYGPGTWEGEL